MALIYLNRLKETTTTTGTGDYVLAGAVISFQAFSIIGNGNTCGVTVFDATQFEEGIYTYNSGANSLTRTLIESSSNAGAAVNWGAGTKTIALSLLASQMSGVIWKNATITIPTPRGEFEWRQTITDAAVTALSNINLKIAPAPEGSFLEYDPEFTEIASMSAYPATGSFHIVMTFREPHSGPINLQYQVS